MKRTKTIKATKIKGAFEQTRTIRKIGTHSRSHILAVLMPKANKLTPGSVHHKQLIQQAERLGKPGSRRF